jgi:uncharacterized protein YecT (DUF1311 family)
MKTTLKLLLAATTLALPMTSALAASACSNPSSDFDQVYCYAKLFMQADTDLNVAYKNLVSKLNPDGRAALKKSELAWIKTRNGQCTETRASDILVNLDCTVEQTVSRTHWLGDRLRECSASGCMNEKLQ